MKQEIFVKIKENKMKCYRIYSILWIFPVDASQSPLRWKRGCIEDGEHVNNADFSGRMETERRVTS